VRDRYSQSLSRWHFVNIISILDLLMHRIGIGISI